MSQESKVVRTLYIEEREKIARRIRSVAYAQGEVMAEWANELGVSRQYISQVVNGRRQPDDIRKFIEDRLGERFWSDRKAA